MESSYPVVTNSFFFLQRYSQDVLPPSPHSTSLLPVAAKAVVSAYTFPVQILIQNATDGSVLASVNANELLNTDLEAHMLLEGFDDPVEFAYYSFLYQAVDALAGKERVEDYA